MKTINPAIKHIVFIVILLNHGLCHSQDFIWPVSTPEKEGLDPEAIATTEQLIETGDYGNMQSLVIIKNGKLVYQKNFAGFGQKAPVYSITKSIGAILLGIADYQGHELNVTASMMDYMSQYSDITDFQNKQNISVLNLMDQRHGLAWDEWTQAYETPDNPVTLMLNTSDWYRTVLEWPTDHSPNSDFAYSTGASSLMSVILKQISGSSPQEFISEHLYQPLDIDIFHWELVGANGLEGTGISNFPQDLAPLGFGIWLKPIDLAKIGEMIRNDGVWQDQRLLASEWVERFKISTSNGVTDPDVFADSNAGYGFQWWQTEFKDTLNRTHHSFYANGFGRQYIFILPESDMVIVSTSKDFDRNTRSERGIGYLLRNHLLAGVEGSPSRDYFPISNQLNGSWFWPENSGQGFHIESLDERQELISYWYTYTPDGNNQRWFLMQGEVIDNVAKLEIMTTENGSFIYSESPDVVSWGQGEIHFDSCRTGTFSFTSEMEQISGNIPLTRLTGSHLCEVTTKNQLIP